MTQKSKRPSKSRKSTKAPKTNKKKSVIFRIVGRVTNNADGQGMAGLLVKGFDKDLRGEQPLGSAITNAQGDCEITYTADQFRRAEKESVDLIVRVFDVAGAERGTSEIYHNAPSNATINVVVTHRELSEYEQLVAELASLLQSVPIADLKDEHIALLIDKTGIDRQRVVYLQRAARLSKETGLPPEVFYAWSRQGLPHDLNSLLESDLHVLRAALEASLKSNIVPARLAGDHEEILQGLKESHDDLKRFSSLHPGEGLGHLFEDDLHSDRDLVFSIFRIAVRAANKEDGQGVAALKVQAFDENLRAEQPLGSAITDAQGDYEIIYTASQIRRAEKENADLTVCVFDAAGAKRGTSEIYYNAPRYATINVVVEIRSGLLQLQRLHELSANSQEAGLLLDNGFYSAQDIVNESRTVFIKKLAPIMGSAKAAKIYAMARAKLASNSAKSD